MYAMAPTSFEAGYLQWGACAGGPSIRLQGGNRLESEQPAQALLLLFTVSYSPLLPGREQGGN